MKIIHYTDTKNCPYIITINNHNNEKVQFSGSFIRSIQVGTLSHFNKSGKSSEVCMFGYFPLTGDMYIQTSTGNVGFVPCDVFHNIVLEGKSFDIIEEFLSDD